MPYTNNPTSMITSIREERVLHISFDKQALLYILDSIWAHYKVRVTKSRDLLPYADNSASLTLVIRGKGVYCMSVNKQPLPHILINL